VRSAVRSGLRFAAEVRTVESLPDGQAGGIVDARTWD
jgi:phenylacetate-CoA ligase